MVIANNTKIINPRWNARSVFSVTFWPSLDEIFEAPLQSNEKKLLLLFPGQLFKTFIKEYHAANPSLFGNSFPRFMIYGPINNDSRILAWLAQRNLSLRYFNTFSSVFNAFTDFQVCRGGKKTSQQVIRRDERSFGLMQYVFRRG